MKIAGILNSDNYMEFSLRVTKEGAEIVPISDFPFPNTIFHVVLTETIEMNEQTESKTTTCVSFPLQSTRRRDTAPPNRYASPFAVPRST